MCEETKKAIISLEKTKRSLWKIIFIMITVFVAQLTIFGSLIHTAKDNKDRIDFIGRDYVPAWFLTGMYENMNYQTEEIVATMNGDAAKIKEINQKYIAFQKMMLNNLIQLRGGISSTTRSAKPEREIQ